MFVNKGPCLVLSRNFPDKSFQQCVGCTPCGRTVCARGHGRNERKLVSRAYQEFMFEVAKKKKRQGHRQTRRQGNEKKTKTNRQTERHRVAQAQSERQTELCALVKASISALSFNAVSLPHPHPHLHHTTTTHRTDTETSVFHPSSTPLGHFFIELANLGPP